MQGNQLIFSPSNGANHLPSGTNHPEASASKQTVNALAIGLHKELYIKFEKWEDHEQSCPKHPNNRHKFATANETKKEAGGKGSIIQDRSKKKKAPHR